MSSRIQRTLQGVYFFLQFSGFRRVFYKFPNFLLNYFVVFLFERYNWKKVVHDRITKRIERRQLRG